MSSRNWDFVDNATAMEVVDQATRRVARNYGSYVEYDDLRQEAILFTATREDLQECVEEESWGYLQHRLEQDLVNHLTTIVRRANKNTSYEAREESLGDVTVTAGRLFSDLHEVGFRGESGAESGEVYLVQAAA